MTLPEDPLSTATEASKENTVAVQENTAAVEENTAVDAITTAREVTAAVKENTEALRKVRIRMAWMWGTLALVVVSLIIGSVAFTLQRRAHLEACHRDNILRQANIDLWLPILNEPIPLPDPDATPEEIAAYQKQVQRTAAFRATVVAGFATHECSGYLF